MPTDEISDADRNAAIDQSIKTMLGLYPKGSYSPRLGRDQRYLNMYAPPVTENGDPYLNKTGWGHAAPDIVNAIPRTTIGATGIATPDQSSGALLSHVLPAVNIPYEPEGQKKGGKVTDRAMKIAYDLKRAKRAVGGGVHTGPIHSAVGGRTDHLAMNVPSGAYVIPADVVSGLGEGNTLTGQKILQRMFPEAAARGGKAVPIMAAGGEHVISPQAIVAKYGNLDRGHKILDSWVVGQRKKLVKTLKKLPGPARS